MNFKKSLNRIISAALAGTLALTMVSFPHNRVEAKSGDLKVPGLDNKTQYVFEISSEDQFDDFITEWTKWNNEVNGIADPQPDKTDNSKKESEITPKPVETAEKQPDTTTEKQSGDNTEKQSDTTTTKSEDTTKQTETINKQNETDNPSNNQKTPVNSDTEAGKSPDNPEILSNVNNAVSAPDPAVPPQPVGVLTRDIEFPKSHVAYKKFSGTIYGDGHIMYAPTVIFEEVSDALFINVQFSVKRTSSSSYVSNADDSALIANNAIDTIFISCFSTDTLVPMLRHQSGCQFINCYTEYKTPVVGVNIEYLPDSQMRTQAFAYILNHPTITDKELEKKFEPRYAYKTNSVPVPIKRTPTSSVEEYTKEPLEYRDSAYQIKNSSDLLSLAILTKLGMLKPGKELNGAIFVQATDIRMSTKTNANFVPIGTPECPFENATYDGQGFMIYKLETSGGVFNNVQNATIVNLAIEEAKISPNKSTVINEKPTGILINTADNVKIDRCYVTGSVTGAPGEYVGGMIGSSKFIDLSNCYSMADITPNGAESGGGFTGYDFKGSYKNIYVAKSFKHDEKMGGLFGYLFAPYTISNCYYNMGSAVSEDDPNFAFTEGELGEPDDIEAFPKSTAVMRTLLFADKLNPNQLDPAFGWKGGINDSFPILYDIGAGKGVKRPEIFTVKLKQPKGAKITITYNDVKYDKNGDEFEIAEGAEIELSYQEEYTYKFKNYRAKINKKGDKKFTDNKLTITGDTEITADIDKNGVTVSFSYSDGGYVKYDSLLENSQQGVSNDSVTLEKGAQFEFEIVTDYGYRIKKVTYTAGTLHKISENKYRISRVSKDGTVKVEFEHIEKEELKEVVDDKTGDVVVKVNKQTDMIDQIAHNEGNKIQTEMGKATMLSGKVLNELYGEDVAIQLVMKDYRWDINGTTLTRTRNRNINMGVNIGQNKATISDIATLQLENHEDIIPLNLVHRGDFPFTGYLTLNVGEEQQYRYASLFYYNPRSKVFEFQECNDVAENGDLTYRFTHASDYVIVIENEPIWDLAAGEGMAETEMPIL